MLETTTTDTATTTLRLSFLECVKAGFGFSLGAVLLPAVAVIIQATTKLQVATLLTVLHIIR